MSIKSAVEEIRRSRKLALVGTDPYCWEILSTKGDYKHHLVYDETREEIVCVVCEANGFPNRCWARGRVLDDLARRFGKLTAEPPPPPAPAKPKKPEPERLMTWQEVMAEAKERVKA